MIRRYIQVNDPHVSDQPPRMRTGSYLDDVLAKLAHAAGLAAELEAALVITGDLFHRKNAAHTTHRTVQRVRAALDHAPLVYIVPGNHDEAHGGGLEGQPLLSVVEGGIIRILDGTNTGRDPLIGGVPWDNAFERPGGAEAFAAACNATGRPLIFAHAPITLSPYPFGPEALGWFQPLDLLPLLEPNVALIAHGHMHGGHHVDTWKRQENADRSVTFSNPGALSRASIAEHDVGRVPQVALIEFDPDPVRLESEPRQLPTVSVRYLPVPHRPAEEVFRLAVHERAEEREDNVAALAAALGQAYAEIVDEEALRASLAALERPADINEDVWAAGIAMATAAIDGEEV